MTTRTPQRHDPAPRLSEIAKTAPTRQRGAVTGLLGLLTAAFTMAVFASGGGLSAFATTAPPTVGTGGSGSSGAAGAAGSISSARPAGVGCSGCDDGDACTEDSCDAEYNCIHTPITCDDGLRCTEDLCDPATGCVYTPLDCSTGSVCITHACSEAIGACVLVTKRLCNDHNACTVDSCDPETGCFYSPVLCNDHDRCTLDACDPRVGCVHRTGACGHGPGDSAPPGSADAPGVTAATGDAPAEATEPPAADRDGARSRAAREAARRAIGGESLCALAASPPADTLMRLLTAGWPSSPGAVAGSGVEWSIRVTAEAALASGLCPSEETARAAGVPALRP